MPSSSTSGSDRLELARFIVSRPILWSVSVFGWCFTGVTLLDRFLLATLQFETGRSQLGLILCLTVAGIVVTLVPAHRAIRG